MGLNMGLMFFAFRFWIFCVNSPRSFCSARWLMAIFLLQFNSTQPASLLQVCSVHAAALLLKK